MQKSGRQKNNAGKEKDEDGSADIIDMNSSCISLANGIRFSHSAVVISFNRAQEDTLWHIV